MSAAKRRRKKKYAIDWKRLTIVLGALVAVVVLTVGLANWLGRPSGDPVADNTAAAPDGQMPSPVAERPVSEQPGAAPTVEAEPAQLAGEAPKHISSPAPTGKPGKLPVLARKKDPGGKYLALTIDDCFQSANIRRILELADEYDAKFTFFPVYRAIRNDPDLWREIHDRGHEIENHTYSHADMTKLSREDAIAEITRLSDAVNKALGMNYTMHFFRPPGGAGMKSKELHEILIDLDYRAVASWGLSGTHNSKSTLKNLQEGQVILFHTTDKDLIRLENVIPGAVERGYTFVTLNTLYGQEPNAVTPLED